jgi:hypothetical protein
MGASPSALSVVKLKELAVAGPFTRRAAAWTYAGEDLVDRDSTIVFLDWDDTLFPSTWVQRMQRRMEQEGKTYDLHGHPKMKALGLEIASFLKAAAQVGHVFIVTAAAHNFIRKCCRVCFPELLKVFDTLHVTIIYARPSPPSTLEPSTPHTPHTPHEHAESIETWKEVVFRKVLAAPHERPLVPRLARFYGSPGWRNVLGYGDQWTDHSALRNAAAPLEAPSLIKTVKAHSSEKGLTPASLALELRLVRRMLPHLFGLETGCSYDLDDPAVRKIFDFPLESGESRPASSKNPFSNSTRIVPLALTPPQRSLVLRPIAPPALGSDPSGATASIATEKVETDLDTQSTQTIPDYVQDSPLFLKV